MHLKVTSLVSVLSMLAACRDGFVEQQAGPDAGEDLPKVPCEPGTRTVLSGSFAAAAGSGDRITLAYQKPNGGLFLQGLDATGALRGLPYRLGGGVTPRRVRMSPGASGELVVSFDATAGTGWDKVFSSVVATDGSVSPARERSYDGSHSTSAVAVQVAGEYLTAYRREIPATARFNLVLQRSGASWGELGIVEADLALGNPISALALTSGAILQTDLSLLSASPQGSLTVGLDLAGVEQAQLIAGSPPSAPFLLRASDGAIDKVLLDNAAKEIDRVQWFRGADPIRNLRSSSSAAGELAIWQDHVQPLVASSVEFKVRPPVPVPLAGSNLTAAGVVAGAAGPLALIERDGGGTAPAREVVVVQVCEP
jgi:hypothetical protein